MARTTRLSSTQVRRTPKGHGSSRAVVRSTLARVLRGDVEAADRLTRKGRPVRAPAQ